VRLENEKDLPRGGKDFVPAAAEHQGMDAIRCAISTAVTQVGLGDP
jgi:hypothetical protein